MTEATQHALEQAERIVQYAKYSDRFMVVEGNSTAERRAFVKLIGQKLPRQVRPVVLPADSGNGPAALIDQVSTRLHLSAGIETIDQLVAAATAVLEGSDRLLVIVENADHWLASGAADALFDLITQSQQRARERILFLLVGAAGLCEQVETAPPLAGLVADLHCAQLLGTDQSSAVPGAARAGAAPGAANEPPRRESAASGPGSDDDRRRSTPPSRPIWASPILLIAAVVSIAVVTLGVFALLGRSNAPTPSSDAPAIALTESTEPAEHAMPADTKRTEREAADGPTDGERANGADDQAEQKPASGTGSMALPDEPATAEPPTDEPETTETTEGDESETSTESGAPRDTDTEPKTGTHARQPDTGGEVALQDQPGAKTPVTPPPRDAAASTPPSAVDNAWFRDRPRARAAIQLAAFGKLESAESMIERFATDELPREQWRIYTQSVNGKVLYTVTFGDFASTERAAHAIDALPTALRELEPYPRSVGAIQDRLTDPAG